ncbi:hypothetical protein [Planctomyces sp. SH-PL62]|uniref:hypothetical protein n=1 Tax=Planctomyces sp. SH-PL62 TaxID=1636152 RepID=UPI00078EC06E|nr:hypothetical protein [Planctomyces sp. SH-PL62]AMV37118.1 hypothetical protein VT85_06780 [Planctomyces sp. SH-PL62]
MSRFWECPSCRALLTRERLEAGAGCCPYCDARVGAPADFADPDASPAEPGEARSAPFIVPATVAGKLHASFALLLEQFPVIAGLVLMIALPSNAAVEMIVSRDADPNDLFAALRLKVLVDKFFGPIHAAAVITLLAARMGGRRTSFLDAARAGIDSWPRVLASRAVAAFFILIASVGFLLPGLPPPIRALMLLPGIVLTIRFCLVDEVAVLEDAPLLQTRRRSAELVSGRAWLIVAASTAAFLLIAAFSLAVGRLASAAGILEDPLARALCDTVLDVFAAFFTILLFLFYWEARSGREGGVAFKPALEEHPF